MGPLFDWFEGLEASICLLVLSEFMQYELVDSAEVTHQWTLL